MAMDNVRNNILIVAGLITLGVCLLADQIGIGSHSNLFGYKQIAGTAIGAVLFSIGLINMATEGVGDNLLIAVGLVVLAGFVLADPVGIGAASTVFGYKQIGGTVVGAILLAVGLANKLKD